MKNKMNTNKCKRCNSNDLELPATLFIRGWNKKTDSHALDTARLCNNCGFVNFVISHKEYLKNLPKWVKCYEN